VLLWDQSKLAIAEICSIERDVAKRTWVEVVMRFVKSYYLVENMYVKKIVIPVYVLLALKLNYRLVIVDKQRKINLAVLEI